MTIYICESVNESVNENVCAYVYLWEYESVSVKNVSINLCVVGLCVYMRLYMYENVYECEW